MYAIIEGDINNNIDEAIDRIVPHIFGTHDKCQNVEWCTFHKDPSNFT